MTRVCGEIKACSTSLPPGGTTLKGHRAPELPMGSSFVQLHSRSISLSAQTYCLLFSKIWFLRTLFNTLPTCVSLISESVSWRIHLRHGENLFRYAQRRKVNIEYFDKLHQKFFTTILIQQNLSNIYDVLGIVLSTEEIKLNKIEFFILRNSLS